MERFGILCVIVCFIFALGVDTQDQCKPPSFTSGYLSVTGVKNVLLGEGIFSYNSQEEELRFSMYDASSNQTMDFLFLFNEGIFYEFNNETQACLKKRLNSHLHPMAVQPNMTYYGEMVVVNVNGTSLGIGMSNWVVEAPEVDGFLVVSNCKLGCITLGSALYTRSKEMLFFSFINVLMELKDPHAFELPEFCHGVTLGSEAGNFFGLFLNQH